MANNHTKCRNCDHERRWHDPECKECWANPELDPSDVCEEFETVVEPRRLPTLHELRGGVLTFVVTG